MIDCKMSKIYISWILLLCRDVQTGQKWKSTVFWDGALCSLTAGTDILEESSTLKIEGIGSLKC